MWAEYALRHVEQGNDLSCSLREAVEKGHYWSISYPNGRFVDRYRDGQIVIAGCYRQNGPWRVARYNGFVAFAKPYVIAMPDNRKVAKIAGGDICFQKSHMLPHNVELVEGVKRHIPSFVGPQRFDFGEVGNGKPLFAFDVPCGSPEVPREFADRKVRSFARLYASPAFDQCGTEQVKSASCHIDDSTDFSNDHRIEGVHINHEEFVSGLSIILGCGGNTLLLCGGLFHPACSGQSGHRSNFPLVGNL
jgi:hypothetical protein